MEEIKNNYPDVKQLTPQEEEESSFDFMGWLSLILHYWYLFVIAGGIALFAAYLSNRKWIPIYQVAAKMIIEDGGYRGGGTEALMQGFGVQQGYKNVNNQIIMFSSSDLMKKAIERLDLQVDYYTQGRFKYRNLYKKSPIKIESDFISDVAYQYEFQFRAIDDKKYKIIFEGNDQINGFTLDGNFGEPLQCSLFFITVNKTDDFFRSSSLYFKFKSIDELIGDFSSRLSIEFVMKGASVISVNMTGHVYERDIDFLNTLCEEFLKDNLSRKNDVASKTIDFIDSQLMSIADSLSIAENNLREFRSKNKMLDLSSYSANLASQINIFEQKRVELNLKETYLNYLTNYLKGNIQDDEIVAPSSLGVTDAGLMSFVRDYMDIKQKRDEMGVGNPYYKKYDSQLSLKKESLLEVLKNMQADFNIEKKSFNDQYALLMDKIALLPEKESQMINFQRIYKIHDNYYTFLMQKRADAQIQKASNSPDNILLDNARMMSLVNGAEKKKKYSQNLTIGLLIPLVFIVLKELLNTTIRGKKDVKKYTRYDIIGSIRRAPDLETPVLVKKRPRSLFTEGFRLIRTRLEFVTKWKEADKGISVLITSSQSGDGKSYFSINLSGIYSMEGKKTILIDLDLRKPSIAKTLEIEKRSGVSNYLIGQSTLDEIILKDDRYPFDLILSGTIPPNPGELIKSPKMKELLETLKSQYDCVIIDTSPIGLVGDAYALTDSVNVTLFMVRNERTNKLFFKTVVEQIKEDNIPIYIVLNDVDFKKGEYSGYLGYVKNSYSYYSKEDSYYTDAESTT